MKRFLFLILAVFLLPLPALGFNQNFIISDKELEDYTSMNLEEIKDFLSDHNSFLQYFADFYPEDGTLIEASEIIWRVSQQFKINPKFLLTLLEKEQGLISISKASVKRLDWAMGYAVCDKCSLSHPKIVQFKGFAKQVYAAAEKIRNDYLTDLEVYGKIKNGFGVGITKKVDRKYSITPVNRATAILYTYTPHIAGNKSFYILWKNWFSELKYPDGSLLQDIKSGGIYLIEGGEKRPFLSKSAFLSRYNEDQIVEATPHFLARYTTGLPIKFDNFSLLRDENGNIYLFVDEQLRPFDSVKTLKSLGLDTADILDVKNSELDLLTLGEPVDSSCIHPTGRLMQLKSSGGVYWVYSGKKYPITDNAVLKSLFSKEKPLKVTEAQLEKYALASPLKFKNGTLLKQKGSPTIYFVSGQKLRPILSEEAFLAYNWKWENVISTTDKIISLYEIGDPITLNDDKTSLENEEENSGAENEELPGLEISTSTLVSITNL
ncbi:MAG: hypothetical protein WC459_02235 [Patescibacteria group bacterium]